MRIVSWNILNGGEGRADPLAEVIEANKPDVVVLIEADDAAVVERIANRLKMDYIVGKGEEGSAAILSRYTIVDSVNFAGLDKRISRACLRTTLGDPNSQEIVLAAIHLIAKKENQSQREKEADAVLEHLQNLRTTDRPHILAGDFNCDPTNPAIKKFLAADYADSMKDERGGTFTTQDPSRRYDFVFTFGIHATKGRIETDRLAKYASDHFPIVVDIK